jgi:hypothetical protein
MKLSRITTDDTTTSQRRTRFKLIIVFLKIKNAAGLCLWIDPDGYIFELVLTAGVADDVRNLFFAIDEQGELYLDAVNWYILEEEKLGPVGYSSSFCNKFQFKNILAYLTAYLKSAWMSRIKELLHFSRNT